MVGLPNIIRPKGVAKGDHQGVPKFITKGKLPGVPIFLMSSQCFSQGRPEIGSPRGPQGISRRSTGGSPVVVPRGVPQCVHRRVPKDGPQQGYPGYPQEWPPCFPSGVTRWVQWVFQSGPKECRQGVSALISRKVQFRVLNMRFPRKTPGCTRGCSQGSVAWPRGFPGLGPHGGYPGGAPH
jgi:hypothetical protein